MKKVREYFGATEANWKNPQRQRKHSHSLGKNIQDLQTLLKLSNEEIDTIKHNNQFLKQRLTPYLIELIQKGGENIAKQFLPKYHRISSLPEPQRDTGEDFFIDNIQNKYDDSRILVRIAQYCDALCQFCFESARTLTNNKSMGHATQHELDQTLEYIKKTPTIDEIIFSGGDPMTLGNFTLQKYLTKIRSIDSFRQNPLLIRINTRNMTFNPFRFDEEFADICHKYRVNNIGLHIAHGTEITHEVENVIKMFGKRSPYTMFFLNTPLLRGVNDDPKILKNLLLKARMTGIHPNYIYHTMPETPSSGTFHVPIQEALAIMDKVTGVTKSSMLRPQFAIVPSDGKFLPTMGPGDKNYEIIDGGIKYKNRKGEIKEYCDPHSTQTQ